jgi:hypothetical protein
MAGTVHLPVSAAGTGSVISLALALQLQFQVISESMGDPGSEIMDGGRFDRDDTGALGVIAA